MSEQKLPPELDFIPDSIFQYRYGINEIMEQAAKLLLDDIRKKQEMVIKKRLSQKGININFEEEKRKRFKSLVAVNENGHYHIYYNDGSPNGLRVVTFVKNHLPDMNPMNFSVEMYYY